MKYLVYLLKSIKERLILLDKVRKSSAIDLLRMFVLIVLEYRTQLLVQARQGSIGNAGRNVQMKATAWTVLSWVAD